VLQQFNQSVYHSTEQYLARDDQGRLVALVDHQVWRQEPDGTWARPPDLSSYSCRSLYILEDGGLCFTDNNRIWILSGGRFLDLGAPPVVWGGLVHRWQLAGSWPDDLWLLTEVGLLRYDGLAFVPVLRLESVSWNLVFDVREGALLWGDCGLIAVDRSGATRDLTPQFSDFDDVLRRVAFDRFSIASSGDWLGIEYRAGMEWPILLRRVDGRWDAVSLAGAADALGTSYFGPPQDMVARSASHVLFNYSNIMLEMDDTDALALKSAEEGL
jgi:hypothetical protein